MVAADATDSHRGVLGRHLIDDSEEALQDGFDLPPGNLHRGMRLGDLSEGVVGIARRPEPEARLVLLVAAGQPAAEPGHGAHAEDENARSQRIEGAAVSDAPNPEDPASPGHHIVRRRPAGFVDDEDAPDPVHGHPRVGGASAGPPPAPGNPSMRAPTRAARSEVWS